MSDRRVRAAALAAATLAAGCAVNQDREVSLYRHELDRDVPAGASTEFPPRAAPLTLSQAMLLANRHNEQLAIGGETYVQALIDKARAVAGFLPTFDLNAGYSAAHSTFSGGGTSNVHTSSVSLRGSMTLIDFGNFSNYARAAATVEQRRFLLLDLQQSILLSVAQTYYQILKLERSVVVLQNTLQLQTERVRDIQARGELGMSRPLDLAQAQADESRTKVTLLQAQSDARTGRATLAFLIGMPYVDGPLPDEFEAPAQAVAAESLESQALQSRPDFVAARYASEAAGHAVDTAIRQWYPTVSLSVNDLLYSHPSGTPAYGLSLSALMPIFSAGLIYADVRSAWSVFRAAKLNESLLSRQIHEEVVTAAENLQTSRDKVAELRIEVDAAQRALDLADAQYKLGAASNLDRLTAQDSLLNAQLLLTSEEYNIKIFYLDLLRQMGTFGVRTPETLPPAGGGG
jgi:outer membrane protein TolC